MVTIYLLRYCPKSHDLNAFWMCVCALVHMHFLAPWASIFGLVLMSLSFIVIIHLRLLFRSFASFSSVTTSTHYVGRMAVPCMLIKIVSMDIIIEPFVIRFLRMRTSSALDHFNAFPKGAKFPFIKICLF